MKVKYVMRAVVGERRVENRYSPGLFKNMHILECGHFAEPPVIESRAAAIRVMAWQFKDKPVKRRCYECASPEATAKARAAIKAATG